MTEEENKEQNVEHFLDLIRKSRRGKFKVYIGMSAGVGKTYRMLQEAHSLLKSGMDIKIGYIEPQRIGRDGCTGNLEPSSGSCNCR